jgi:hypothetical protein
MLCVVGIVVAGARVAMGRSSPWQELVTVAFDGLLKVLEGGIYVARGFDDYYRRRRRRRKK